MTPEDIPEAFQAYERGDFAKGHLIWLLLDLISRHPIDEILRNVPADSVAEVIAELELFHDGIPLDEISIFNSAAGEHPQKATIVNAIRAWLRLRSRGS